MTSLTEEDGTKSMEQIMKESRNIQIKIYEGLNKLKQWMSLRESDYELTTDEKEWDEEEWEKKERYERERPIYQELKKELSEISYSKIHEHISTFKDAYCFQKEKDFYDMGSSLRTLVTLNLLEGKVEEAYDNLINMRNYYEAGELAEEVGNLPKAVKTYNYIRNDNLNDRMVERIYHCKEKLVAKYQQMGENEEAIKIINSVDSLEKRANLAENNEYYEEVMKIREEQQNYEQAAIMAKKAGFEEKVETYQSLAKLEKEKENLYKTLEEQK